MVFVKGFKHSEKTKLKIKRNNVRYWLGKKRSPETVEKIRKANLGYKHINRKKPTFLKPHPGWIKKGSIPWNKGLKGVQQAWNKGKKLPQFSGKNNPSWKGGITPVIHLLRKSDEYKKWRKAVYKKDNYTCYECGKRGGRLEAHHLLSFSKFVQFRFYIQNGITLCKSCHSKIKTKEKEFAWFVKFFNKHHQSPAVVEI